MSESETRGDRVEATASDETIVALEARARAALRRVDLPMTSIAISLVDLLALIRRMRDGEAEVARIRAEVGRELDRRVTDDDVVERAGELSTRELRIATRLLDDLAQSLRRIVEAPFSDESASG